MRQLLAIGFLFLFSFHSFVKVGIWTWYEVNKAEITAKFCENKSKPSLHCNGKCHLAKQLSKADNKTNDSKAPAIPAWKDCSTYFIHNKMELSGFNLGLGRATNNFKYSEKLSAQHLKAIDRPPSGLS